MLRIDNLSASYKTIDGNVLAVENVTFDILDNEIFGIAGESGCGKSTLLKVLYDIIEFPLNIDRGTVVLSGEKSGQPYRYASGSIRSAWWKHISYVPQAAMSVLNPITRIKSQFLDSIPKEERRDKEAAIARIAKYLKELDLSPDILNAFPFQLSGGMRQRVIIALATFMGPGIVLADEPTTALDVVVQRGILMMLMDLQKQLKNTMVLVSHDMGVHYQTTNRMGIMYAGSIVELGRTRDMFEKPLHPYTDMLIGALPRVGDKSQKKGIPGAPPSLRQPPPGCRFAPRCPNAVPECQGAVPPLREIVPGHYAACHRIEKGGNDHER